MTRIITIGQLHLTADRNAVNNSFETASWSETVLAEAGQVRDINTDGKWVLAGGFDGTITASFFPSGHHYSEQSRKNDEAKIGREAKTRGLQTYLHCLAKSLYEATLAGEVASECWTDEPRVIPFGDDAEWHVAKSVSARKSTFIHRHHETKEPVETTTYELCYFGTPISETTIGMHVETAKRNRPSRYSTSA